MAILLALLVPVAVLLLAAAAVFGGRAARPMNIAAFVLSVFAVCLVLINAT